MYVVHTYKNTVACVGGAFLLVKTACTYLPCGNVICVYVQACGVCVYVCECMRVLHTLRTNLMHCTTQIVPAEMGCG